MDSSHSRRALQRSLNALERSACVSALAPFGGLPGPFLLGFGAVVMRRFLPIVDELLQEDAGMPQAGVHNPRLTFPLESTAFV